MSDPFSHRSFDHHEQVIFVSDSGTGLRGIIGIHNTVLGAAAGGCRMYPYASTDEALDDVLRLSRGMTMKNSAAGLPLGGGKCVIIGDPLSDNKEQLLRAMARQVQRLAGRYWTAIDVGVNSDDADTMAEECDYIFARTSEFVNDDPPAHYTAVGGFQGVRAVARYLLGSDDMRGLKVAVQGVGQTGADLIALLLESGATVVAADVNESALSAVANLPGVEVVSPEMIYAQEVDVFAPCAMGAILNDSTIPQLKCKGIAGMANNQLERAEHGRQLLERNIAYAPDFIVNSGGIIRASMPIFTTPDKTRAIENINGLFGRIVDILERSHKLNEPTESIAEQIAMDRIRQAT